MSVLFKAEKRVEVGSSAARKIKRCGNIPAVIYDKNGNINLSLDRKEFEREYYRGDLLASIVTVEVDSKAMRLIAHKIELDPVSDNPIHVDFLNCDKGSIRAKSKLRFINQEKSPGLKKGGFLHIVLRKIEIVCDDIASVPSVLEVDVGSMHVGQKIRASSLKLVEGVSLIKKEDFLIASIVGRGKSEGEAVIAVAPTSPVSMVASPATSATSAAVKPGAKSENKK